MKVLLADKISKSAGEILKKAGVEFDDKPGLSEEEIVSIIPKYDGLVVRSGVKVTPKILEAGKKLKVVGRAGVGTDNIDKEKAKELGIAVENTPLGNTNAAAEHTITMLMMLAKHVIHGHLSMKKGEWERKKFKGTELKCKTLGIVGIGNVGKKVAKVALALEMDVIGFDPFVDEEKAKSMGIKKVELDEVIKTSDFITVHVPLNDKTRDMVNTEQFAQMKDGVRILNVARGGVVNEKALLEALNSGKVSSAAIDVWEQEPPTLRELVENEKVIATPHLGASTAEAQENVAIDVSEQIVEALKNGKIVNCVNGVEELRKTE
ncbi:hydroxyacid dehydrogenase [Nanoarchaeota archaeon]